VTDFVDVIIRSVQEQKTARHKTQKEILDHLTTVKAELVRVNQLLRQLQECEISRQAFLDAVGSEHSLMSQKLADDKLSLDALVKELESIAIRDEMAKVEELVGRLTSHNPLKHGQWRPFWNASVFGKGSKLRRTLSSMQHMSDELGMGEGYKFDSFYHEFGWLKQIVTHDIPQIRAELKKERDVLFTGDKIFDQDHYLTFLQHCDFIETQIGMKSNFVTHSGSDLQVHMDTIKEETLFEVRNHYVDLLLHYLFKSYDHDDHNNFIFYQAQELMELLSSEEGAILDAKFLNNWRTICETNKRKAEPDFKSTLELHAEIEHAHELGRQNGQAMEDFLLAFYRRRNPGDVEGDAIANLNLQLGDKSSPKMELLTEIKTNNRALKDLFCYRFLQTAIQLMPAQKFESSLSHVPMMHQFFKDTFFRKDKRAYHLKQMTFPYGQYQLIPPKYQDAEAAVFKHIKETALYTDKPDINFSALKRVPDCYRRQHQHTRWEWTMDPSGACAHNPTIPLTMTASNQYWLLKKFQDFVELVQKVIDRISLYKVASQHDLTSMEEPDPIDEDGRAQAFDDYFVKRFTGMSHA